MSLEAELLVQPNAEGNSFSCKNNVEQVNETAKDYDEVIRKLTARNIHLDQPTSHLLIHRLSIWPAAQLANAVQLHLSLIGKASPLDPRPMSVPTHNLLSGGEKQTRNLQEIIDQIFL